MKLRPRYKFELDNVNVRQAGIQIYEKSQELSPDLEILKAGQNMHFYIPKKERKIWTPYLAVTFEETESGVIVRGNIGPSEKIWLPFIFLYGSLITAILFITIYGFVQLNLGHSANALWFLIPLIFGLGGFYLFSYLGQRKSSHCVLTFHNLLHRSYSENATSFVLETK